ncbi:MAG: DUF4097 family beta strand repeat protein [Candidatus Eisenbacteria bacterium]|nr:DUF4097 family beta strand repeat protein [Candidatus Eisenbacteria bacterium]
MSTMNGGRITGWMLAAVAAVLVPATAIGADDARRTTSHAEDFAWSGRIAAGRTIEIKGVNGGIVAEPARGSEVEVTAVKHWRKSRPEDVRIEVVPHDGGVTICTVYPTPAGEPENRCESGDGGHMSTRDNDVSVDYRVRVPAGVRLIARTVNGAISARDLGGDAEAATVNGDVRVATRGVAAATTVNGSIDVEMGRAIDEPTEFTTVNGGITLSMPADLAANLQASTLNGSIASDYELNQVRGSTGRPGRRHRLSGTIGRGGPALTVTTVNGDIRLHSGS